MLEPGTHSRMYDAYLDAAMAGDVEEPAAFLLKRGVLDPDLAEQLRSIRRMAEAHRLALAEEVDWLPDERLGDFRVLRQLGKGGMGVVFLAEQTSLGRLVALKVIRPAYQLDKEAVVRLQREARSIARLRHPNIVTIHAFGEANGVMFFAMELIDGESLRDVLQSSRPPITQLIAWTAQIARALHCAHSAGVLHRDVKTANIMIERGARPILLDFGLAREEGATPITRGFVGTRGYASSEQMRMVADLDGRSDQFSLGVTLYRALTGRLPFGTKPMQKVLKNIERDDPVPPTRFNMAVKPALEEIVLRALRRERDARFPTALAFAEALETCLE